MRFHFCNQKKEIVNLKNETKRKGFVPPVIHFKTILNVAG